MLNKTRLSYLLREMLLEKGIKNLLEFTDSVSEKGLRLANNNSLSSVNLQNSLKNKDRAFFKSNRISRKSFYKEVTGLIKREKLKQERGELSEKDHQKAMSISDSQFHFGPGDNIKGDKTINRERKESFIEKFFWHGIIALIIAVLAGVILIWLMPLLR